MKGKSGGNNRTATRGRGRPPKIGNDDAQANFLLPKPMEQEILAYQEREGITSRGEVYRQILRIGLNTIRERQK